MENFSQLFLYIPGIIIFLVGSGRVREYLRLRRPGAKRGAQVQRCNHVQKKDKNGRITYDYYDVTVEYTDPATHHKERRAVKSPVEYAPGQSVSLYVEKGSSEPVLAESRDESMFNPWVTMAGGALLILLALFENQGKEVPAMSCLALVLAGAGIAMVWNYIKLKKLGLQEVDAEITDVFKRQISKETKILRGSKFTYYPIVRFNAGGKENIRRCAVNSSREDSFKIGEKMKLYLDPASGNVLEKHASPVVLITGILIAVSGILAGASILSVVL